VNLSRLTRRARTRLACALAAALFSIAAAQMSSQPDTRQVGKDLGDVYQRSGRLDDAKRELAIAEQLQGQPGR
jgi:hypothetical protein